MTRFTRIRSWLGAVAGRRSLERRMQIEMETHLELLEADLQRQGFSAAEAHRRARAEFGSVEARKDECREAVGLRFVGELRADTAYTLRILRRSPGFTLVALLSLALGIGANTAIFSLVDMVIMKTLPVRDPASLVFIDTTGGKSGGASGPPYPLFETMRDSSQFLSGLAAFNEDRLKITIDGNTEQLRGQFASGNYFELLGIQAFHGRLLTAADDSVFGRGGRDGAVCVISYNLWRQRFALDPGIVGRAIRVGENWVTIVGVTPPGFFGLQVGSPIDITLPMMLAGDYVHSKSTWWMSVVGRIGAGASVEQAQAELSATFNQYMTENAMARRRPITGVTLVPANRGLNLLRRQFAEPLLILMAIVALLLLIGCANVANLLLARASARRTELSIRLAIGASRARLVRQLLTEGLFLVSLGTTAGLAFAYFGVRVVLNLFANGGAGVLLEPHFDLRVLGFTATVAAITVLLFSMAPALHAARMDAAKPGDGNLSLNRPRIRFGHSLVILQITLAVVLLCGAALFLRTFHSLTTIDAGFQRDNLLTMQIEATMPTLPPTATASERRTTYSAIGAQWNNLAGRVSALEGVSVAAVGTMSPLTGRDRGVGFAIRGTPISDQQRSIHLNQVSAGYFRSLGVSLVAGRLFTDEDRSGSTRVAILNETAARSYFADASPLGRRIIFPGQRVEDEYEIVGIVGDVRYANLRTPDERMAYIPIDQPIDPIGTVMLHVRGAQVPTALLPFIRSAARDAVPGGFVTRIAKMSERVDSSLLRERLLSMLATVFGGLALALACIGLYGVAAFAVVRRTREIGIRVAVGARHASVIWMLLRDILVLVIGGVALGMVVALLTGRYLSSQLFGVTPGDPLATGSAIALLLTVTLVAAYVPARRATRIDPVIALRYE